MSSLDKSQKGLINRNEVFGIAKPRPPRSANDESSALDKLRQAMSRDEVFDIAKPRKFATPITNKGAILTIDSVNVSFDGFKAINDLNLAIDAGELRCIIGPNGAGKTTMMDIITGKTRPDSGKVYFGQTMDVLRMSEADIAQAGIGRKFQKPTVFECLSVAENLELAMKGDKGVWSTFRARLNGEQQDYLNQVLETIGLQHNPKQQAEFLSHGQKQWLEIGMLLMQKPHLLLVDEPAAGMTHQEMDKTAELLNTLAGDHSIVVVEHDMDFVRSIARRVTVLHQGHVLAEGSMDQVQQDQRVIEVYLGE